MGRKGSNLLRRSIPLVHGLSLLHLVRPAGPDFNLVINKRSSWLGIVPLYNKLFFQKSLKKQEQKVSIILPPLLQHSQGLCTSIRHRAPRTPWGSGSSPSPHVLSSLQSQVVRWAKGTYFLLLSAEKKYVLYQRRRNPPFEAIWQFRRVRARAGSSPGATLVFFWKLGFLSIHVNTFVRPPSLSSSSVKLTFSFVKSDQSLPILKIQGVFYCYCYCQIT